MKKLGLCIALGLSLGACAGGINSGTMTGNVNQNNVVTQYPVETAMLNIYVKERSQKLMAVVGNQNVLADIKVTPKGSMVFNNKQVQGTEINTITKSNNQVINQSVVINYFTLKPLVFQGFTDSSGEYSLSTQTTTIPKLAKVGDSSPLITETVYSDSSKRKKIGMYSQDWSLTRDTNNTAWFCINSSENTLLAFDPNGASVECYKINAKGDILDSRLTIKGPEGVGTINFTSR
ncbi:hypothetical protein RCH20_000222 [Psychrobacter sp. PL15]|jgi:hypothetical protein|uniref:hypothetical protein n=1 Tax=unclassified Psychrobacter TaxID=196806 RepID=UPI001AE27B01|nr:hypothetical protein [Psychrobacter sp. PL15]MEC5209180.1 hypothetical protein [Psychrobacter sp. PL15]